MEKKKEENIVFTLAILFYTQKKPREKRKMLM